MKKHLLAALSILAMAACQKTDVSNQSLTQSVSNNSVIPELSTCKIRRIYQEWGFPTTLVNALFSYNKAGNPHSVLYSNGGTGVPDHYFFYDSQNRLIEYRQTWGDFPVYDHFYTYDSQNRIVKDSIEANSPGSGQLHDIKVSTIEYDSQNRVVKETIVHVYNKDGEYVPTRRPTYTYDARGNLAVAGWKSSSYDGKINPLRQNAVFQFIFRNYSMNNASGQPKYNSRGLPLSINPGNDGFFNYSPTAKIVYDCQ